MDTRAVAYLLVQHEGGFGRVPVGGKVGDHAASAVHDIVLGQERGAGEDVVSEGVGEERELPQLHGGEKRGQRERGRSRLGEKEEETVHHVRVVELEEGRLRVSGDEGTTVKTLVMVMDCAKNSTNFLSSPLESRSTRLEEKRLR